MVQLIRIVRSVAGIVDPLDEPLVSPLEVLLVDLAVRRHKGRHEYLAEEATPPLEQIGNVGEQELVRPFVQSPRD